MDIRHFTFEKDENRHIIFKYRRLRKDVFSYRTSSFFRWIKANIGSNFDMSNSLMKNSATTLDLLTHNDSQLVAVKRIALDSKFVVLLHL